MASLEGTERSNTGERTGGELDTWWVQIKIDMKGKVFRGYGATVWINGVLPLSQSRLESPLVL